MEVNLIIFIALILFLIQLYKTAGKAIDLLVETAKAALVLLLLLALLALYEQADTKQEVGPPVTKEYHDPIEEDTTYNYIQL